MADGRQLRNVSGDQAVKAFIRAGGVARSGKGDHLNVKMPNGCIVTIPRHREVKIGLLQAAIKRAGLTVEQFADLL